MMTSAHRKVQAALYHLKKISVNLDTYHVKSVTLEQRVGNRISDVYCVLQNKKKQAFIEVVITNPISFQKKLDYQKMNCLVIVVDLHYEYKHGLLNNISDEKLLELIKYKATYLNNPDEEIIFSGESGSEKYKIQTNFCLNRDYFLLLTKTKCCLITYSEGGEITKEIKERVERISKQRKIKFYKVPYGIDFKVHIATKKALPLW